MKKLFLLLAIITFGFTVSPNENDTCWYEFKVPPKKGNNNQSWLKYNAVCINGYAYLDTPNEKERNTAYVGKGGLIQMFEIYDVGKGIFLPRTCSCLQP